MAQTADAGTGQQVADVSTPAGAAALRKAVQLDPRRGEQLALLAEARARQLPAGDGQTIAILTAQYFRIEALIQLNRGPAAAPLIDAALKALPSAVAGSKLHGDLLLSRAAVQSAAGNAKAALDDYQAAYRLFLAAKLPRNEAVALMGIGSIYQNAGEYERVLYYYGLADAAYPGDPFLSLSSANNQGNALAKLRRFAAAELKYRDALKFTRALNSPVLEARILNNVADMQVDQGKLAGAEATISQGLRLAETTPGADAWRRILLGTAARIELERSEPAAAVRRVEFALRGLALRDAADQSYRSLHAAAYRAYRATGDPGRALTHFELYKRLDDEGRAVVTQTSAALLSARFDFANQNLKISQLTAGQLKRDIALARLQARQSALILGGLLAVATIVALALALYLYVLRRSRDAAQAANLALSKVNAELEFALSAKSRFLATTSHEIRTPLNGVLGMTQVMLSDPGLAGDSRERIQMVHDAGETMRELVDDILDFAKLEGGKVETAKAPLHLAALAEELVRFWTPQATAKGLTLTLAPGLVPDVVNEDARRLRQILSNLLANAIKFTDVGTVRLSTGCEAAGGAEWLVFRVADTGIGIPLAAHETIFEMFNQVDNSTSRRFGGTGLGLSISRGLARILGGDITVASEPGQGATFTLKLPLTEVADVADTAASPPPEGLRPLGAVRVVIAGGPPITQRVLASVVSPHVAAVTLTATLPDAAALTAEVVIIDATDVPENLYATWYAQLDNAGRRPRIIVVAPPGSDGLDGRFHGADRILERPLQGSTLIAALNERSIGLDGAKDNAQFTEVVTATA